MSLWLFVKTSKSSSAAERTAQRPVRPVADDDFVIQIKNGKKKHVKINVNIYIHAKKDYSWDPSTSPCENSKYLKRIADTSVI